MIHNTNLSGIRSFLSLSILFLLLLTVVPNFSIIIFPLALSSTTGAAAAGTSSSSPLLNINRTTVLSPYVREFDVPMIDSGPAGITVDPSGNVWFMEDSASKVGVFFPSNESFKEYPFTAPSQSQTQSANLSNIASLAISQIAYDSHTGNLWFTWAASNSIGQFDPKTGQVKFYQVPTKAAGPFDILISPNDMIWFTEILGNKIGELNPVSGNIEESDTPTSFSGPGMMTFDSKGRIWFAETYAKKIGVLDPNNVQPGTPNGIQEYAPPFQVFSPLGITFSGGDVWFTDHGANSFGEFIPQNNTWRQFWVNPPIGVSFGGVPIVQSLPAQILIDKNGNVWLAEHQGNRIARFDPSNGTLIEYLVPTRPLTETLWLALDQNGNAWFTEHDTGKIGIVNASKTIPFSVSISNDTLFLQQGRISSSKVSVSFSSNASSSVGSLNFTLSGMSTFGLENMTYSFSPAQFASASKLNVANLSLDYLPNLQQGNYSLLVGASNDVIIESVVVPLVVKSSSPSVPYDSFFIATVVGILVAASLLTFFIRKRKKRFETIQQFTRIIDF